MQGSFFKVMSPLLDLKYNDSITVDFKLPPPKHVDLDSSFGKNIGNIVHYFDKEKIVFLYLDSKTKAVTYDITNGIHRKIKGSESPNAMDNGMERILHIRLGKESLFQEDIPPVYLHLIFEISSVTRFFFNFEKSSLKDQKINLISKLIFAGYTGSRNQVQTQKKIKLVLNSIFFQV